MVRRICRHVLLALLAVLLAVLLSVPYAVPSVVERLITRKLAEFGLVATALLDLRYCWRNGPGIAGNLYVALPGTPWRAGAAFGASCGEWSAYVRMPETSFTEGDPLLAMLLAKYPPKGVSDLAFSGRLAFEASAVRTFSRPLPVWKAGAQLTDLSASLTSDDQRIAVAGLSVKPSASGIADHVDVAPMFLRAKSLSFGAVALTNFHATVRATEKALMVNEAGAGIFGGKAHVYSLYLNPQNLSTGFTLFLDNVDAGEALALVKGFEGEASGRLHGKVQAFVREGGRAVHLRDMFLYSTPGETGKLRMSNPAAVTDNLAYAGLNDAARANVADALSNLDYKVLRFDLKRTDGGASRLSVQVGGTATRGGRTVPVDVTINLNGELEQILNQTLDYSDKLKGKRK